MASTDSLDELLCIMNENIPFIQKETILASVKSLCARAIVEESRQKADKKGFDCTCAIFHICSSREADNIAV